jgi:hypothetical protein
MVAATSEDGANRASLGELSASRYIRFRATFSTKDLSTTPILQSVTIPLASVDVDHFRFGSINSPQALGMAFSVVITAENSLNSVVTTYTDTANLQANLTGTFTPTMATFDDGVASLDVTFGFTGTNIVLEAVHPVISSISGESNAFDVVDAPSIANFTFANISSPQVPGHPFTVTITAEDADGQTVTAYNGTADLSINSGGAINPDQATFTNGEAELAVAIRDAAEDVRITATAGSVSGESNAFDLIYKVYLPLVLREEASGPVYVTQETEPNDTYGEANGPLGSAQNCTGRLDDEKDFYFFEVENTGRVTVDLTGYSGTAWLELVSPSGSMGTPEDDGRLSKQAQVAGTYYVVVKLQGQTPNNSTYTLKVVYP